MRSLRQLLAVLFVLIACGGTGRAALDPTTMPTPSLELWVYEHRDCVYCQLFRRDVLPRYKQGLAAELPIRFVDIAIAGNRAPGLRAKVDMLPTAVLMLDGREF